MEKKQSQKKTLFQEYSRANEASLFRKAVKKLGAFKPSGRKFKNDERIQLIDFFSGAGGTSLGFQALNGLCPTIEFLGACDIDLWSSESYSTNFETPLGCCDILEISKSPENIHSFFNKLGYNPERKLILIGCAPCQGFSSHRKKDWDKPDDKRDSLAFAFTKIVHEIKPDAILMENVPEFLSKRYWSYFQTVKNSLEQDGYVIKEQIYDAASFGVPQERFRSILIGMRKNFCLPNTFVSQKNYSTVRDAIGDLEPLAAGEASKTDYMHKSVFHKKSTLDVIRQVPHNGGSRPKGVGPKCLDKTKGFSDVYGRLYWDRPSITITHYVRNPASGRYVHPEQDRGLTAREAARLQSFPDGFHFEGNGDDIYRQIGEAVPPKMATGIALSVVTELLSNEPSEEDLSKSPKTICEPVSSSFSSVIVGLKKRVNKK